MQMFMKTLMGKPIILVSSESSDTTENVEMEDKEGFLPNQQWLILVGKQMECGGIPSNNDIQKQSPVCPVPCLWTSIVERPCASLNTNLSETRWSTVNDNRPAPCTASHTHTNNLYSNEVKESLGLLIWAQLWGLNTAPLSRLQQKIQKVIHKMKWNEFAKWTYPI